jgi:UrcA family protein
MTRHLTTSLTRVAGLAGAATLLVALPVATGVPAFAATVTTPTLVEELIVIAPHVIRTPGPVGRHGQRTEILTLERRVSYADLDLTKPSDAAELRARVRKAAKGACADLEARAPSGYGTATASEQGCEGAANAEALAVVDQLVAAASAR